MRTTRQPDLAYKGHWRQRRRLNPATLLLAVAGLFAASSAQSIEIAVLDAQYSTDLYIDNRYAGTTTTLTTTSTSPIVSELQEGEYRNYGNYFRAAAQANTLSVGTSTAAYGGKTIATADTVLNFKTLDDGIARLTFEIALHGSYSWTEGFFSLYDLTTSQSMFSYGFCTTRADCDSRFPQYDPVSWADHCRCYGASLTLESQLYGSHDYMLTMHFGSDASSDSQGGSISLLGVQPVPEPSTYALMLAGLLAVGLMARRRKGQSPERWQSMLTRAHLMCATARTA